MTEAKRQLRPSQWLALAAIPCMLGYLYIAVTWGLADIYARPAMNAVTAWKQGKRQMGNADWQRYRDNLRQALALDPDNPDFHLTLGHLIEGPFTRGLPGNETAAVFRREAAAHYRRAIALRPTWPYGYIDLATVKYRLLEFDDEFYRAVHDAARYGPWEPDIQRVEADLGMVLWNVLPAVERAFLLGEIRRSFRHASTAHVRTIQRSIQSRGFVERVCAVPDANTPLKTWCDSLAEGTG